MTVSAAYVQEKFKGQKVIIIGDVMIDSYIWGKVERISPEAPVPIINVEKREKRLGGAANVALNILALGAEPILCSVIGNDSESESFKNLLTEKNLRSDGLLESNSRITTIKHRVLSHSQQLLRIDQEDTHPIDTDESALLFNRISTIISQEPISVVIFEDYDKGVITSQLITNVVNLCNSKNIPTVVDPKKRNFLDYKNVTLFKPNLKELKEGLKIDFNSKNVNEIQKASIQILSALNTENVFVTLSELGVIIATKIENIHINAHKREITDVSGAGDTVVSVAALCMGAALNLKLLAELSNLAGGIVCEKVGVVPVRLSELLEESKRLKILE